MNKPFGEGRANAMALQVEGLGKSFGTRTVFRDVSFCLPAESRLAIFGPNGAGKTTLLRILSTLDIPSAGTAKVLGMDVKEDAVAIRGAIGVISHSPMVYPDLSAKQNLTVYGRLYGVQHPSARAEELLDQVGLSHRADDPVKTFSRGMTQRMAIARAFVHNPQLVFLDEPYAGLDPKGAALFDQMLEQYAQGRTFVMVSHDVRKAYAWATHYLVLGKSPRKGEGPAMEFGRTCEGGEVLL